MPLHGEKILKNDLLQNSSHLIPHSKMSDTLSEEELSELVHHGRINTSRSEAKRRQIKKSSRKQTLPQVQRGREAPPRVGVPASSKKEPDPDWLEAQKMKVERNIATPRQDKQRRDEMQEASRF